MMDIYYKILMLVIFSICIVWFLIHGRSLRRKELMKTYGDVVIVCRIVSQKCWLGQTDQMVKDSFGTPVELSEFISGDKKTVVWGYGRSFPFRLYTLRIIIENGVVSGWDRDYENHSD